MSGRSGRGLGAPQFRGEQRHPAESLDQRRRLPGRPRRTVRVRVGVLGRDGDPLHGTWIGQSPGHVGHHLGGIGTGAGGPSAMTYASRIGGYLLRTGERCTGRAVCRWRVRRRRHGVALGRLGTGGHDGADGRRRRYGRWVPSVRHRVYRRLSRAAWTAPRATARLRRSPSRSMPNRRLWCMCSTLLTTVPAGRGPPGRACCPASRAA